MEVAVSPFAIWVFTVSSFKCAVACFKKSLAIFSISVFTVASIA